LEVLLFELGVWQGISGEHREFTRAWISTLKSKLLSPFQ
jgi:hypothetical protein